MLINVGLLNDLFRGFHIQRWNDRIRPMNFLEMDKHSHKMMIAYCLGRYEEDAGKNVDWLYIIKNGIFELFRRIIISDIKSTIYAEIRKHKNVFSKLNEFVFQQLEPKFDTPILRDELEQFLFIEPDYSDINTRILEAAHIYSSLWEFQIIKQTNPGNYQNTRIEKELYNKIDMYYDLIGIQKIMQKHTISNFIDLCGQLRFQIRWAQSPRIPQTAVLGHTLLVAVVSYFFARENQACPKRIYNNFFGGLFHDLPETVTRDIISPVKRSSKELDELVKKIEYELAVKEIFPLVEKDWLEELKYFIVDEFENKIFENGLVRKGLKVDDLNHSYNKDEFNPIDGRLIRAADHLAAFLEAWNSIRAGVKTEELSSASQKIKEHYSNKTIGKVSLGNLYSNF